MRKTSVTELDFSTPETCNKRDHPMIDEQHKYIALIDGQYSIGWMVPVWFGWHFANGFGASGGQQFDPPGTNGCLWQRVWRVDDANGLRAAESILLAAGLDPVQIAKDDEMRYAETRRRYCIDHKMVSNGQPITEESPIEAYLYVPTKPIMPEVEEDNDW